MLCELPAVYGAETFVVSSRCKCLQWLEGHLFRGGWIMTEEEAPIYRLRCTVGSIVKCCSCGIPMKLSLKNCSGSLKYALFISLFNPVMQMDNHSCPHACFFLHTHNHMKPCTHASFYISIIIFSRPLSVDGAIAVLMIYPKWAEPVCVCARDYEKMEKSVLDVEMNRCHCGHKGLFILLNTVSQYHSMSKA